jgi:hypothetical protein
MKSVAIMNAERKRPTVTEAFDNLERATVKVSGLLKDRAPGTMSWNLVLKDACIELDLALRGLGIPPQSLVEKEDKVQYG